MESACMNLSYTERKLRTAPPLVPFFTLTVLHHLHLKYQTHHFLCLHSYVHNGLNRAPTYAT